MKAIGCLFKTIVGIVGVIFLIGLGIHLWNQENGDGRTNDAPKFSGKSSVKLNDREMTTYEKAAKKQGNKYFLEAEMGKVEMGLIPVFTKMIRDVVGFKVTMVKDDIKHYVHPEDENTWLFFQPFTITTNEGKRIKCTFLIVYDVKKDELTKITKNEEVNKYIDLVNASLK